jgi:hypothetical protein
MSCVYIYIYMGNILERSVGGKFVTCFYEVLFLDYEMDLLLASHYLENFGGFFFFFFF